MSVIQEGTPGKWSLLATHPKRLGAVAELYATTGAAEGRAAVLRLSGHTVEWFRNEGLEIDADRGVTSRGWTYCRQTDKPIRPLSDPIKCAGADEGAMERGLKVELSPNEEATLRQVAFGLVAHSLRGRDLTRLKQLDLIGDRNGRLGVTALGEKRMAKAPPASLDRRR